MDEQVKRDAEATVPVLVQQINDTALALSAAHEAGDREAVLTAARNLVDRARWLDRVMQVTAP